MPRRIQAVIKAKGGHTQSSYTELSSSSRVKTTLNAIIKPVEQTITYLAFHMSYKNKKREFFLADIFKTRALPRRCQSATVNIQSFNNYSVSSVGLAQARPNNSFYIITGSTCICSYKRQCMREKAAVYTCMHVCISELKLKRNVFNHRSGFNQCLDHCY